MSNEQEVFHKISNLVSTYFGRFNFLDLVSVVLHIDQILDHRHVPFRRILDEAARIELPEGVIDAGTVATAAARPARLPQQIGVLLHRRHHLRAALVIILREGTSSVNAPLINLVLFQNRLCWEGGDSSLVPLQ